MTPSDYTPRRVITVYLVSSGLFTLATSLIWAVNTLFLMGPGKLTIFQVMLVNTVFVIGQAICEVPTGVIADTIGRKASYLFGIGTLILSTLLYVLTPILSWGIAGFYVASALLGLGYTFQTGAVDAWLVDALNATGWDRPKNVVFAWAGQVFGAATLIGSLLGGVLGQINLELPYVVRSVALIFALVYVAIFMREIGFVSRPLRAENFVAETRTIFDAGTRFGWRNKVVRPLLWVSLASSLFMMFGFYAWQRYMLDLLGHEFIWMAGVVQAAFSVTAIIGNRQVHRVAGEGPTRRDPGLILMWGAIITAVLALGMGLVGLTHPAPGWGPWAAATAMWLGFGLVFGVTGPVSQGFINEHIPSAQRATVLSLQAFFGDLGGAVGQPTLGYIAEKASIAAAFVLGSGALAITAPLYAAAGRAARREARAGEDTR